MSNVWLCQEMRETYNVHHNKIGCNKSFLAVRTYRKLKICILDMNSILLSNTSNSSDTNNVACVVLQFVVSSMLTKYAKETDNKLETRLFFLHRILFRFVWKLSVFVISVWFALLPWVCQQWLRRCVVLLCIESLASSTFCWMLAFFSSSFFEHFVYYWSVEGDQKIAMSVCCVRKFDSPKFQMTNIIWGKSNCFGRRCHRHGHLSNYTVAYPTGDSFTIELVFMGFSADYECCISNTLPKYRCLKSFQLFVCIGRCVQHRIHFCLLENVECYHFGLVHFGLVCAMCESLQKRSAC